MSGSEAGKKANDVMEEVVMMEKKEFTGEVRIAHRGMGIFEGMKRKEKDSSPKPLEGTNSATTLAP